MTALLVSLRGKKLLALSSQFGLTKWFTRLDCASNLKKADWHQRSNPRRALREGLGCGCGLHLPRGERGGVGVLMHHNLRQSLRHRSASRLLVHQNLRAHPKPQTLNPNPSTLNPKSSTPMMNSCAPEPASACRLQCSVFMVQGAGTRVSGSLFRVPGFTFARLWFHD